MRPCQIFIVGMNGSGTTMLLDCLAGHSLLFAFNGETKALPYFIRNQARYGDLANDVNLARLWREMRNAVGGRGWRNGADEAWSRGSVELPRSVAAIFDAVMSTLAAREGKSIWCEKTPMYVHNLSALADAFPSAKFIHVIRDGRDCAASFHRRWRFNPQRTMHRWKEAVRAGRTQGLALKDRYFEIRYERLTIAPETELREICVFLEIPFEAALLSQARSRPEMTGSTEMSIAPNNRRADQYFEPSVLTAMESISGRALRDFGYAPRYTVGDDDPSRWRLRIWELQDDFRRLVDTVRTTGNSHGQGKLKLLARRIVGAMRQRSSLK